MGALLAKCGVTSIRTLVMLMGGVKVDALKADGKTLPKLKGIRIARCVRRAMVKALAKSSWFALLGVFRCVATSPLLLFYLRCWLQLVS